MVPRLLVIVAFVVAATACASEPSPQQSISTAASTTAGGAGTKLVASGTFDLVAASSFESEGFHEVITVSGEIEAAEGTMLTIRLRDESRPSVTCNRDHPVSGCATVDWSDFEDRPGVPPGGVFEQRLTLPFADGPMDLYLSETGRLNTAPDEYSPG